MDAITTTTPGTQGLPATTGDFSDLSLWPQSGNCCSSTRTTALVGLNILSHVPLSGRRMEQRHKQPRWYSNMLNQRGGGGGGGDGVKVSGPHCTASRSNGAQSLSVDGVEEEEEE